jgi:hypothetical protein
MGIGHEPILAAGKTVGKTNQPTLIEECHSLARSHGKKMPAEVLCGPLESVGNEGLLHASFGGLYRIVRVAGNYPFGQLGKEAENR